jgi:hypothetical protein
MVVGEDAVRTIFSKENDSEIQSRKASNNKKNNVNEYKLRKLIPFDCPEGFEVTLHLIFF